MNKMLPWLLTLALVPACESEPLGDPPGLDGDDRIAGDMPENAVEIEQQELARIDLGDGEVVFTVDSDGPEAGTVSVLEAMVPDKDGVLHLRESTDDSALALFLRLTDESTPVPRALIDSASTDEERQAALARGLVDHIAETLLTSPDELPPASSWSASYMCNEGTTSKQFLDEICPLDDYWSVNYCHNGTWYSITDDTFEGDKSTWSRGRTLACGGNGRQRHYYKFWGVWYKPIDNLVPSGNLYRYTRHKASSPRLRRKITHSRTGSGFVRAASDFD